MKRTLLFPLLALCLCLLFSACSAAAHTNDTAAPTPTDDGFISEAEAIAAAEQHFGIQNGSVDQQTGFLMGYRITQTPTTKMPVYKVALQWQVTVNGEVSHWSMLDTVEIDAIHGGIRIL